MSEGRDRSRSAAWTTPRVCVSRVRRPRHVRVFTCAHVYYARGPRRGGPATPDCASAWHWHPSPHPRRQLLPSSRRAVVRPGALWPRSMFLARSGTAGTGREGREGLGPGDRGRPRSLPVPHCSPAAGENAQAGSDVHARSRATAALAGSGTHVPIGRRALVPRASSPVLGCRPLLVALWWGDGEGGGCRSGPALHRTSTARAHPSGWSSSRPTEPWPGWEAKTAAGVVPNSPSSAGESCLDWPGLVGYGSGTVHHSGARKPLPHSGAC
jgi:hypothetical protein